MIEPCSSFVNIETIRLHYLEWDSAKHSTQFSTEVSSMPPVDNMSEDTSDNIPIVLLHGLSDTAYTWCLLANLICEQNQVVAFDQRGHGQSDYPESGYDMVTMAEDIISGMAKLGLGQVALVAHGWGARIALVLAARHPALISHLILVDCPHVEPRHWPGMTRERFIREQMLPVQYASRESYLLEWHDELGPVWSPEIEKIVLASVRQLSDGRLEELLHPEYQRQLRASFWEDRALTYYAKLHCPVLLIPAAAQPIPGEELPEHLEQADEFAAAKGQMAAQVARAIPNCAVHWMPETAHDIQLQCPDLLAEIILRFLQSSV